MVLRGGLAVKDWGTVTAGAYDADVAEAGPLVWELPGALRRAKKKN